MFITKLKSKIVQLLLKTTFLVSIEWSLYTGFTEYIAWWIVITIKPRFTYPFSISANVKRWNHTKGFVNIRGNERKENIKVGT